MSRDGAPLVSVVMIFRDAQAYLDEAIASVIGQSHRPLELLLCDDGSTDASTATARGWANRYPAEIRYFEHPTHAHRGMSATRNLGIRRACGDLVAFLDADDVWDPDHLRQHVELIGDHPEADVVCGGAVDWRSWQEPPGEDVVSPLPWPVGTVVRTPDMLLAVLHRGAYSTPTCSLTARRDALLEIGGAEDAFTGMYEDQALLAKLHLSRTAVIGGGRTAYYRQHAESSSARAMAAGTYDPTAPNPSRERYLRWLACRPEIQAMAEDGDLRSVLSRELEPYDHHEGKARSATSLFKRALTANQRRWVRGAAWRVRGRAPGLGVLRWTEPVSRSFGFDRGTPVDRYYIERFLEESAYLVRGRVLEIGDDAYTRRYGGRRVSSAEVLNVDDGVPGTTYVADLSEAAGVPSDAFDCVILTQTLHLVYDMPAAVRTVHRVLRPGGTVLATVPGISQIADDRWSRTWYWSLTPLAASRLFGEVFGPDEVEVRSWGNVAASVAFLEGVAAHELSGEVFACGDSAYPLVVTVRAGKSLPHARGTTSTGRL